VYPNDVPAILPPPKWPTVFSILDFSSPVVDRRDHAFIWCGMGWRASPRAIESGEWADKPHHRGREAPVENHQRSTSGTTHHQDIGNNEVNLSPRIHGHCFHSSDHKSSRKVYVDQKRVALRQIASQCGRSPDVATYQCGRLPPNKTKSTPVQSF
jgi:hypothetical protein